MGANLEVDLQPPFAEAAWPIGHAVRVGNVELSAARHCVRCQMVDVDPDSVETTGPSLLAALATSKPFGDKGPTFGVLLASRTSIPGRENGRVGRASNKVLEHAEGAFEVIAI